MKKLLAIIAVLLGSVSLALADSAPRFDTGNLDNGQTSTNVKPRILDNVGIDQHLNMSLPLDAVFTDQDGRSVKLGDYFHDKPVVLNFIQFSCQKLCTYELNGLCRALNGCMLEPGKDYTILTVSFDPRETAKDGMYKKRLYVSQVNHPGVDAAWNFLTGSQNSIDRITQAAGFRYVYDAPRDQFVHSAALMIVTPDGRLSKYLYGTEYGPNDLRLSVADAAASQIGAEVPLSDQILLFCFHYDPVSGKYTLAVQNLLRAGAALTLICVAGFIVFSIRREKSVRPTGN